MVFDILIFLFIPYIEDKPPLLTKLYINSKFSNNEIE